MRATPRYARLVAVTCALSMTAVAAVAQTTAAPEQGALDATARAAPPAAPPKKTHRWFDLQTLQVDSRYRLIETSEGVRTSNTVQHKQTVRGGFKFDPAGRYSLQAGLGTGSQFVSSWEGTGAGPGEASWAFSVRTLYLEAAPVAGLEVQAGGLAPIRGESTEITTFDNDGYFVGERVSVRRPALFYLDEISVTAAYLGDLRTPNVFERLHRLDDHNYTQILVVKAVGPRVTASAEWSRLSGAVTWRQGVHVGTRGIGVVDGVRVEVYERVDAPTGRGFSVIADKALSRRLSLSGGYTSIDRDNGALSGDRYGPGNRVSVEGRVSLPSDLALNLFVTRAIDTDFPIANRTRFDVVVSYNVLRALQRAGAW